MDQHHCDYDFSRLDPNFRENYPIFQYTTFAVSILSLLSVFFVIFMYFLRPNLQNLPYRMVMYLQIADGLVSFSFFLEVFDPICHPGLCQAQAFIVNIGCNASFFWICCITTSIYCSATGRWRTVEPFEKYFVLFSFGFPLILSIMYS